MDAEHKDQKFAESESNKNPKRRKCELDDEDVIIDASSSFDLIFCVPFSLWMTSESIYYFQLGPYCRTTKFQIIPNFSERQCKERTSVNARK